MQLRDSNREACNPQIGDVSTRPRHLLLTHRSSVSSLHNGLFKKQLNIFLNCEGVENKINCCQFEEGKLLDSENKKTMNCYGLNNISCASAL